MSPIDARPNRLPGNKSGEGFFQSDHLAIGETLRARREELGWSLPDMANWLRIRQSHLESLESGKIGSIPGTAYAVGFLRTYAQALGFDGEEMALRFKRETHGALDRKPELTFPQPVSDRGVPVGLWVGAGLAVVIATYIGYYHFMGGQITPAEHVPPVTELMPGVTAKGTTSPQVAAVMPGRGEAPTPRPEIPATPLVSDNAKSVVAQPAPIMTPAASAPVVPLSVAPTPPVTPITASDSPTTTNSTAPEPAPPSSAASPAASALPDAAENVPTTPGSIAVHASADAWVQVKDQAGKTVLNRVLKAGETWQGDASGAPYHMTVGNAGGITLSAGDKTSPPLGKIGAVRRNLEVTFDDIRNGVISPPSAQPPHASPVPGPVPQNAQSDGLNNQQLDQTPQPR